MDSAFAVESQEDEDLSGQAAAESQLKSLAAQIVKRGMGSAAIFFLEMHKPLRGIACLAEQVASPVLGMLLGAKNRLVLEKILASPEAVEEFIREIENLSLQKQNFKKG